MDATFQLLIKWATSVVSSVIATAVAALFGVAVIFARCGVMKLSTNYTHRAQFTVVAIFLAFRALYLAKAFVRFLNCNSAVQQELKILYREHFAFF